MTMTGITSSGFKYSVSDSLKDDYELIEMLVDLEENPLLVTKLVKKVLGEEQAEKLKDHLRDENGVVPLSSISKEIEEIFTNAGESVKN